MVNKNEWPYRLSAEKLDLKKFYFWTSPENYELIYYIFWIDTIKCFTKENKKKDCTIRFFSLFHADKRRFVYCYKKLFLS